MKQNELKLCSCEYIMETEFKKKRYLVDRMLYPGLYILAGAPKVGKSWLAMQLCTSLSKMTRDDCRTGSMSSLMCRPKTLSSLSHRSLLTAVLKVRYARLVKLTTTFDLSSLTRCRKSVRPPTSATQRTTRT